MKMKETHMMYGLVTSIVMIIIGLILHITNLSFEPWVKWLTFGIFFCGILINAIMFSKANDGYVSFGNVFSSGFKMAAIVTLISIVWSLISIFIFPDIVDKSLENARNEMVQQGFSDKVIDERIEFVQAHFKTLIAGGVLFMMMIAGAIFSLIGAAIAKKKGSAHPTPAV